MTATKKTAADVAREYSESAAWVPVGRAMPPAGEFVEVLYADGYVTQSRAVGSLFVSDGMYRYVNAAFWRPIPAKE